MAKGRTFKNKVICHTNDFKDKINENIRRWVESNGGKFSKELTSDVTHLIASKRAWKKYDKIVQQARRMRTVRIVRLDWLEMSLTTPPYKALPEDKWSYEQQKLKFTKKNKRKPQGLNLREDGSAPKKIVIPRDKRIETTAGFHPYSDRTGFVYIITLLRYDILKNRFEKYRIKVGQFPSTTQHTLPFLAECSSGQAIYRFQTPYPFSFAQVLPYDFPKKLQQNSKIHLAKPWAQCVQLYESDSVPRTYACYAQYTRPGVQKQVHILAPPGSTWPFAWGMFEKFFARKTESNWDERVGVGIEINLDGFSKDDDGSSDTDIEREPRVRSQNVPFQYLAPRPGEPDGIRDKHHKRGLGWGDQQSIVESTSEEVGVMSPIAYDEQIDMEQSQTLNSDETERDKEHDHADADDEMIERDDTGHEAVDDADLL